MEFVLWLAWLVAACGTLAIQKEYCSRTERVTFFAVFLSGLLTLVVLLALPLDLSASLLDSCLVAKTKHVSCGARGITYTSPESRQSFWVVVFWGTFVLGWILVPLLQAYVVSGAFTRSRRLLYALRINAVSYGACAAFVLVFGLYVKYSSGAESWDAVMALLMALANAAGLLAAVFFLGEGLVDVPLRMWRRASLPAVLASAYRSAPGQYAAMLSAADGVRDECRAIRALPLDPAHGAELACLLSRAVVGESLLARVSSELAHAPSGSASIVGLSSLQSLAGAPQGRPDAAGIFSEPNLARSTAAGVSAGQTVGVTPGQESGHRLDVYPRGNSPAGRHISQATFFESLGGGPESLYGAAQPSGHHGAAFLDLLERSSYRLSEAVSRLERCRWAWLALQRTSACYERRIEGAQGALRVRYAVLSAAALACAALSLVVLASEVAVPFGRVPLLHVLLGRLGASSLFTSAAAFFVFVYMWLCMSGPMHDTPVLRMYFTAARGGHTDAKSMLFFASMHLRLVPPLAYNFIELAEDDSGRGATQYGRVMGLIDIVPLLGRRFAYAVPALLAVVSAYTLYRRVRSRSAGAVPYLPVVASHASSPTAHMEGRSLLSRSGPDIALATECV